MMKVDKTLKEFCPNGVQYTTFGASCKYIRGVTYNKSQEVHEDIDDAWKVFRANNITLSSNTLNFEDVKLISKSVKVKQEQLLKKGDILICAGSGSKEHVGKVAYIDEDMDYTFGGFMAVIRCNENLNSRFLFHILTSGGFSSYLSMALNSTTINNLSSSVMENFKFPLPPLAAQCEIVQVLDKFTLLSQELAAELAARKAQYEFYRDKLLSFNDLTKNGGGV